MGKTRYYILFPCYTEGMKLEKLLKKEKIKYIIAPTPRELSTCCGISMMYNKEDEKVIEEIICTNRIKILGFKFIQKKIVSPYL